MTIPAALRTTPVTSGADGRCHRVADDAYTAGPAARRGQYTALCGHAVVAAALALDYLDSAACARLGVLSLDVEARERELASSPAAAS